MASTGRLGISERALARETRRKLLLRDSLTFLSLTLLTIALFTVTLFLFRSFAAHRTALGIRWSDRGRVALTDGHPEQAIDSLRTALAYTPGERSYELLLAQALAEAGHTDEAFNYFSGLWETQPGSGFVNLQLARISAQKKDPQQAINFYRAALYGTWEGDGVVRRRDVRLELARYLLSRRDISAARAELLVAEGNADNNSALDMQLGALFEQAGDRTDALETYLKASEAAPGAPEPFVAAGTLAYHMGQFSTAQRLLQHAHDRAGQHPLPDSSEVTTLLHNSERILALLPSRKLSARERVDRLIELKTIARKRLDTCTTDLPGALPPALHDLNDRWLASTRLTTRPELLRDASREDDLLQFILDTEALTSKLCKPATGDDALLLLVSRDPREVDR